MDINYVAGPSALTNDDEVYSHDQSHLEQGKFFDQISQVDRNMYIHHAGPSGLTHDGSLLWDHPAPSPLPDDDPVMGVNLDGEVYGLSNLRQSRCIASCVER